MVLATGGGGITAGKGRLTKKNDQSKSLIAGRLESKISMKMDVQVDAKSKPLGSTLSLNPMDDAKSSPKCE
jgi:hypothetical protein